MDCSSVPAHGVPPTVPVAQRDGDRGRQTVPVWSHLAQRDLPAAVIQPT